MKKLVYLSLAAALAATFGQTEGVSVMRDLWEKRAPHAAAQAQPAAKMPAASTFTGGTTRALRPTPGASTGTRKPLAKTSPAASTFGQTKGLSSLARRVREARAAHAAAQAQPAAEMPAASTFTGGKKPWLPTPGAPTGTMEPLKKTSPAALTFTGGKKPLTKTSPAASTSVSGTTRALPTPPRKGREGQLVELDCRCVCALTCANKVCNIDGHRLNAAYQMLSQQDLRPTVVLQIPQLSGNNSEQALCINVESTDSAIQSITNTLNAGRSLPPCLYLNNVTASDASLCSLLEAIGKSNINLRDFTVNGGLLTPAVQQSLVQMVSNNKNIVTLRLKNMNISAANTRSDFWSSLLNQNLQYLDISSNCIDDNFVQQIANNLRSSNLRELHLESNSITQVGGLALYDALCPGGAPSRIKVFLDDNEDIDPKITKYLKETQSYRGSIRTAGVIESDVERQAVVLSRGEAVSRMGQQTVSFKVESDGKFLAGGSIRLIGQVLPYSAICESINFSGQIFSKDSALAVGEGIRLNYSLKQAIFDSLSTRMGDDMTQIITQLLEKLSERKYPLESLSLKGNRLGGLGPDVRCYLVRLLQKGTNIDLSENNISGQDKDDLSETVAACNSKGISCSITF